MPQHPLLPRPVLRLGSGLLQPIYQPTCNSDYQDTGLVTDFVLCFADYFARPTANPLWQFIAQQLGQYLDHANRIYRNITDMKPGKEKAICQIFRQRSLVDRLNHE